MTLEIEDKSNLKLIRQNDALLYLGDRKFFEKMVAGSLAAPAEVIDRAISGCTSGIVLQKGSKAFEENEIKPELGDKVSFPGHFGHIHCVKDENKDRHYFRVIKDSSIEAICISKT